MICDHYCNAPLRCPTCIRRFWQWAQSHTRGRAPRSDARVPPFYEAAAKFRGTDHRIAPARLDARGDAKPLTEIVAYVPATFCTGPEIAASQATAIVYRRR